MIDRSVDTLHLLDGQHLATRLLDKKSFTYDEYYIIISLYIFVSYLFHCTTGV
jgi:hypothetical protein